MVTPAARSSPGDPRQAKIFACRFAPHPCCMLNAPQRPPQPPQRHDLLFLFFAQDIAHVTELIPPSGSMSWISYLIGRFSGGHQWPVLGGHRGRRGKSVPARSRDARDRHRFRCTSIRKVSSRALRQSGYGQRSNGQAFLFVWTMLALGITATFSIILSASTLLSLPWRRSRRASTAA